MITIYGKTNCSFCTKAKELVESRRYEHEYKDVQNIDLLNELKERAPVEVKTVPQIFIGSTYIGGYNQLCTYLEETGYNGTGETL